MHHATERDSRADERNELFTRGIGDPAPSHGCSVYYRGEIRGAPAESLTDRLFPFDEIPWPKLPSDDMRTMLRRYVDENLEGRYGIYVGDRAGGTVRLLDQGS